MELLMALFGNIWFWIIGLPIGLPMIIWGGAELMQSWMRHKERMAMIERGIHPDAAKPEEKVA
jgi:hypothetical protein